MHRAIFKPNVRKITKKIDLAIIFLAGNHEKFNYSKSYEKLRRNAGFFWVRCSERNKRSTGNFVYNPLRCPDTHLVTTGLFCLVQGKVGTMLE